MDVQKDIAEVKVEAKKEESTFEKDIVAVEQWVEKEAKAVGEFVKELVTGGKKVEEKAVADVKADVKVAETVVADTITDAKKAEVTVKEDIQKVEAVAEEIKKA